MKIAVLSDIHSNLVNLAKAKKIIDDESVEAVFCCGDIGQKMFYWSSRDGKPCLYLLGNADYSLRERMSSGVLDLGHIEVFDEYGEKKLQGRWIGFTHEEILAGKLAGIGKYDLIFFGHTHTPAIKKQETFSY
jgi:putative phosphoesterase